MSEIQLSENELRAMNSVLAIAAAPIPSDDEEDGPCCIECGHGYTTEFGCEPSRLCNQCAQLVADIDATVLAKATARLISALQSATAENERLRDALLMAKEAIEIWHGPVAWIQYQQSPEMKAIAAALSRTQEGS